MKIPVKISRFLIIPIFLIKTKQEIFTKSDEEPSLTGIFSFNTHSQFHADYCTEFLRERNTRYSKNKPNGVVEEIYLNKLIERTKETNHIKSFKNFIDFCYELRGKIQSTLV